MAFGLMRNTKNIQNHAMKKLPFQLLFFIVVAINISSIFFNCTILIIVSKPLIVGSLLCFYLISSMQNIGAVKPLVITAIGCSIIGDVLLLFEKNSPLFFIFGLVSFLLAHIFYSITFYYFLQKQHIKISWKLLPFVACYYFLLLYVLFPTLGNMKLPVVVYGAVISTMFFIALHIFFTKQNAYLIIIGAAFFVLSDTLLAINKFYTTYYQASIFIMITYSFAQYCIVKGIVKITLNIPQQTISI